MDLQKHGRWTSRHAYCSDVRHRTARLLNSHSISNAGPVRGVVTGETGLEIHSMFVSCHEDPLSEVAGAREVSLVPCPFSPQTCHEDPLLATAGEGESGRTRSCDVMSGIPICTASQHTLKNFF